ncbi:acyl-CoA dehydratase activase [Candidatus Woesearchaeota archaeon]|nr:acyl-CoA dehydratase activase [Candidatus Woesearchaeota archaeon]
MKATGICIGASSIKYVVIEENNSTENKKSSHDKIVKDKINDGNSKYKIIESKIITHEGNPRKYFTELPLDGYVCVTGRKFKDLIDLPKITEPQATELALSAIEGDQKFNALISLGSENFILYELNQNKIIKVRTGNKCASGTGEFFLQQIGRMNVNIDEAIKLARDAEPYYVSGRCSVFCKSDCTHALNKGIPTGRVCAGLGDMIAEKVTELLQAKNDIAVVGGVTKNAYVMDKLREKIDNLVIPDNANFFEAFGAAVYAYENQTESKKSDINTMKSTFSTLPPLSNAKDMVSFSDEKKGVPVEGDECILGLDVGSTTTKAALVRTSDNAVLASVYLRTNGNPIKASRECYEEINKQLDEQGVGVGVIGLGVTGSGRHISGLHAMTEGIINEIIAHATAAAYYDKDVDTILEIGGQDAKYTYLINGVPCDYAMNEACSAGTGSFLEEAASETLKVHYLDIQDIALKGKNPPNFNDQCAAFISSDIKNASHENISREDIIAGLVYSICMNYNNRVKGARKLGNKIFMQGGVCYNKAVPLAMAQLIKKPIIVPPDPGLMGAFGVALEVKNRIEIGLMQKQEFNLKDLFQREVEYGKSFKCPGADEKCDIGCQINIIKIDGKAYPFGGACNKYYNALHNISNDDGTLDFVKMRQEAVYMDYYEGYVKDNDPNQAEKADDPKTDDSVRNGSESNGPKTSDNRKTVGILRSFMTNTLFPLYFHFFESLGMKVILSDEVDPEGIKKTGSSFCYPVEIAHGMMQNLVDKKPDYIMLPLITELPVKNEKKANYRHSTCVVVQGEPFFLQSAFRDIESEILVPVFYFSKGYDNMHEEFIKLGEELGFSDEAAEEAYHNGLEKQEEFFNRRREIGKEYIKKIEENPERIGVVLFGRPYNAFAREANMGIPRKFASRGVYIIPFDCLPYDHFDPLEGMYWAIAQEILKAARMVKNHPQLYGTFITNFSCGPDSFTVGYFRDIMKTKPSLTLELDSHSADAGINTRIEAFLDIVDRYRKLNIQEPVDKGHARANLILEGKKMFFKSSKGELVPLTDERVKIVIPSMGRLLSKMSAAALTGAGLNSVVVPMPTFDTLMKGRGHTSCKECLPLILTTASLLEYYENVKKDGEFMVYFMPTTDGNCRFAQYSVFMNKLIDKQKLEDVALLSLTSTNGYAGMGFKNLFNVLKGVIISDVMDDIKNSLYVLAKDRKSAMDVFNSEVERLVKCLSTGGNLYDTLEIVADALAEIPLKGKLSDAKKVLVVGEIYVRRDEFSSQGVIDRLGDKDIICHRSHTLEWLYYVDFYVDTIMKYDLSLAEKIEFFGRKFVQRHFERKIKGIMEKTGLYDYDEVDIKKLVEYGEKFIKIELAGEPILGIGAFFSEIGHKIDGAISIGPFACLPSRITEAIMNEESKVEGNKRLHCLGSYGRLKKYNNLPFLAVECDGNPFPQIIESQIEAFALQVERMHESRIK